MVNAVRPFAHEAPVCERRPRLLLEELRACADHFLRPLATPISPEVGTVRVDVAVDYAEMSRCLDGRWRQLLPVEVANACEQRQLEFIAGRLSIDRALTSLSGEVPIALVPVGPSGIPAWPDGTIGSLAHTRAQVAVIVARGGGLLSIGVDVEEPLDRMSALELSSLVVWPPELPALHSAGVYFPTDVSLAFSLKESLFKCLFPFVNRYVDFLEASVLAIHPETRQVTFDLSRSLRSLLPHSCALFGRYHCSPEAVHSVVTLQQ